jgi:hypothetical protein
MDGTPQETPVRTEKPAGMGMPERERVIAEDLLFIVINPGHKLGSGRNRFAGKLERSNLVIDDDIVAEIHAACPALPAGKNHLQPPF